MPGENKGRLPVTGCRLPVACARLFKLVKDPFKTLPVPSFLTLYKNREKIPSYQPENKICLSPNILA
jgi:hypothetical protein